jgi:hypothetical protein
MVLALIGKVLSENDRQSKPVCGSGVLPKAASRRATIVGQHLTKQLKLVSATAIAGALKDLE